MAKQPDIQYIQAYNYGNTARKLAPKPQVRKEKYQLPEQQPRRQQVKQTVLDPLSVCAIAVASVMLIAMLIGMFRVGELTGRRQELEQYVDVLQEQRADLQKSYEESYDLHLVEQRARQMGLVPGDEVQHIRLGTLNAEPEQNISVADKLVALFDELFAKAPR